MNNINCLRHLPMPISSHHSHQKSFVNKISPNDPKEGFLYYKTTKQTNTLCTTTKHRLGSSNWLTSTIVLNSNDFNLVLFLFRFVINTDTVSTSVKEFLQQYYSKVWMEYVVKNPLWNGAPVTSDLFKQKSDEFIKQSIMF